MNQHVPTDAARTDTAPSPLQRRDEGSVAILTLNQPSRRNALSEAMLDSLTATFAALAAERAIRAVVIEAAGPVFSSGHDLKELSAHRGDADRGRAYFEDIMGRCSTMMQAVVNLPQPVIACIEGAATAAGCQLVASCDLAVAGSAARFCTPGVNIGLFCSTPMVALSRNLSAKHAMEMLLCGDMIDAETAWRFGLVNRVVPEGGALATCMELADKIASKSALTVKIGKQAFYRQREMPLDEAYRYASQVMVTNMLARDAEEGIDAFLAKRAPHWQDE